MSKQKNRKRVREEKRRLKNQDYDNYDRVFTFEHLYNSGIKCAKGVRWKTSVQAFENDLGKHIASLYRAISKRNYKQMPFYEFDTAERGKVRHIKSLHIKDRTVQKCLCEYSLNPVLTPTFIYDNGASIKGKGIDFALKRIEKHLHDYYINNGSEGYVLQYDFSKYFDSIPHPVIKRLLRKYYTDQDLLTLMDTMIDAFGDIGIGLGSQMSQILALAVASTIDHFFKERMRIKYYGRYMDDGYIIAKTKEELHICYDQLLRLAENLGIRINEKKTQIVRLSHGFTFLKIRYALQTNGRIVKHIARENVTRMRHKLKVYRRLFEEGKVNLTLVEGALCSWIAHALKCDSYKTRKNMVNLYFKLFGKETTNRVLQTYW